MGHVELELDYEGDHPDAPVWLQLRFGERDLELHRSLDDYHGGLSRSWIQNAHVYVDVLPAVVKLTRRYAFRYLQVEVLDVSGKFRLTLEDAVCTAATSADIAITADDVLTFLLYLELEDYVDWTTGECRFDSESFVKLLEFVASFPSSFDWEAENPTLADMDSDARIMEGIQLLKQCNFNRFEDAQANNALNRLLEAGYFG